MTVKFHVDPATGANGPCGAQKGKCPYRGNTGIENHYDTKAEAERAGEKILEKLHGAFSKPKKKNAKTFEMPTFKEVDGYGNKGWAGSKVPSGYVPKTEIAKRMRQDLKDATDAGLLPEGLKYSVVCKDVSINIEIMGLGKSRDLYEYDYSQRYGREKKYKPEIQEALDMVETIHRSYNYDKSNIAVDYSNRGFYGSVKVADDVMVTNKAFEASKTKLNKIVSEGKKKGLSNADIAKTKEFIDQRDVYHKALEDFYAAMHADRLEYDAISEKKVIDWDDIEEKSREHAKKRIAETKAKMGMNK